MHWSADMVVRSFVQEAVNIIVSRVIGCWVERERTPKQLA